MSNDHPDHHPVNDDEFDERVCEEDGELWPCSTVAWQDHTNLAGLNGPEEHPAANWRKGDQFATQQQITDALNLVDAKATEAQP